MAVMVETFECEEVRNEHPEITQEAVSLMEELGMEGQLSLCQTKKPRQDRCPYRVMTPDERFVYRVLCPGETDLTTFADEPIPLRVLQVAAHAKALGVFKNLVIWHRKDVNVKDPVLVGIRQDPEVTWRDLPWILARWGEELEEWPALAKKALETWKERTKVRLSKVASEATAALQSIDAMDIEEAASHQTPSFSF